MNQEKDEKENNEAGQSGSSSTHELELTEKVPIREQKVGLSRTYKLDILEKVPINTTYSFLFSTLNKSVTEALKHFSSTGAISLGFKETQEALTRLQPFIEDATKVLQPHLSEIQKLAQSPLIREFTETQKKLKEQSEKIMSALNSLPVLSIPLEREQKFTIAIPPRQQQIVIEKIDKETVKEMAKEIIDCFLTEMRQTPFPIRVVGETTIEEKKNKFPHKLPAGTEWKNFIIQFVNKNEVFIKVNRFQHYTNYAEMGFADNRFGNPQSNVGWTFLWVLAKYNGELTIKDPDAKDTYKKQKSLVSEALKSYFSMESDPFYPYQESKSYKTRFTLLPPPEESEDIKHRRPQQKEIEQESVDEEIRQFFEEQAPQVYDEKGW